MLWDVGFGIAGNMNTMIMKIMYADATKATGPLCVKVVRPHAFEPKLIQQTMRPRLNGPGTNACPPTTTTIL
jgi:hypothetical protein